jgi:hypothetical protein
MPVDYERRRLRGAASKSTTTDATVIGVTEATVFSIKLIFA